jgi:protein-S-isoprenylcysteine O-methyltransferase Ste14
MDRIIILLYGVFAYVIGLGGLVAFALFTGGWSFLPFHIDSSAPGPLAKALAVNIGLMIMMGLQHSVMARSKFKELLTKVIPPAAERSTYVLSSGVVFILICLFWRAIAGIVWHVEGPLATAVTVIQLLGWLMVVAASFMINHFELFGLQQAYCHFIQKPVPVPKFTDRFLYKVVRHPIQLGVLIGVWFTATMSMTHLMLSLLMTVYIFIGLHFEEKSLVAALGQEYEDYKKRVPMVLPFPRPAKTD